MIHPVGVPTSTRAFDISIDRSLILELDPHPEKVNVDNIRYLYSSWLALLSDSPLSSAESRKPRESFLAFRKELLTGPTIDVIKRYSSLGDQLANSVSGTPEDPQVSWIEGFKNTPVFREWHHFYLGKDPHLFEYLYSFCLFGKKLDFENPDLYTTAFRGWKRVEERLSSLQLNHQVTSGLHIIVGELLRGFDLYPFWPKFGPGSVAERGVRGHRAKSTTITYDAAIDEVFYQGLPHVKAVLEGRAVPYHLSVPDKSLWAVERSLCLKCAKQKYVRKDVRAARSIAMEPSTVMYHQQGVMTSLLRTMRSTCARNFVNIQDQRRNVDLARYGSVTGRIDTIDLSSASDSVHVDLVRAIFPKDVLPYLIATRTSSVDVEGVGVIDVNKFAPMGSALCFPVQCIVFTSVVIYAAMCAASFKAVGEYLDVSSPYLTGDVQGRINNLFRREAGPRISYRRDDGSVASVARGFYEPAAIYGDDICVDSNLTQYVTHLLGVLGFEVNTSKSFTGSSSFRESCGGFFLWGHDVTPLRYQVVRPDAKFSSNTVASLVAMTNRSSLYGYRNVRRYLLHILLRSKWAGMPDKPVNPVLFTSNRLLAGSAIITDQPRNHHIRKRWGDTHVYEVRHAVVEPCETEEDIAVKRLSEKVLYPLESYLYMRWWAKVPEESATEVVPSQPVCSVSENLRYLWGRSVISFYDVFEEVSFASRYTKGSTRIGWRWTPVD